MSQDLMIVEPDLQFIKDVQRAGGDSLKKCFQCATCSVVCKVTPDDQPFPRKEMVLAQWGQKEQLMSDPDVWLCHQCNDCTANCPRGAKPGDVLAAIRNASFQHYAFPNFMGKMLSRPAYLPFLLAFPIFVLFAVATVFGNWNMPEGEIVYANFYPELAIDGTFVSLLTFSMVSLGIGLSRFWKAMVQAHGEYGLKGTPMPNLIATLPTILTHVRFNTCGESKSRYWGHMAVFYGFGGAFIATTFVMLQYWGLGMHTPYDQLSHVKLFGNLGGIAIVVGATALLLKRLNDKKSASSYYDWSLIVLVAGLGVSGLATEVVREANMRSIAYPTYFVHLVFVFYLFAYLPFSKMAHIAYRTTAMVFAKQAQREVETEVA